MASFFSSIEGWFFLMRSFYIPWYIPGDAKDTLQKLAEEKAQFDFVFIDANKDGYVDYFKVRVWQF